MKIVRKLTAVVLPIVLIGMLLSGFAVNANCPIPETTPRPVTQAERFVETPGGIITTVIGIEGGAVNFRTSPSGRQGDYTNVVDRVLVGTEIYLTGNGFWAWIANGQPVQCRGAWVGFHHLNAYGNPHGPEFFMLSQYVDVDIVAAIVAWW